MNWLLVGLAAFVAWQVVQDRRKSTPPVGPIGSMPQQPGDAGVSSTGMVHWTGSTALLSQAVLSSMSDEEIALEAAWGNDAGVRAESVRRGIRYTYTRWHELKSRMQGRDGSRDADLLDLGRNPIPLTVEEFQAVDWEWSRINAIPG